LPRPSRQAACWLHSGDEVPAELACPEPRCLLVPEPVLEATVLTGTSGPEGAGPRARHRQAATRPARLR